MFFKMKVRYPNISPDQVLEALTVPKMDDWEVYEQVKVIKELMDEQAQQVYFLTPKHKIPFMLQREFICKFYHKKNYFMNADGSPGAHVVVRVPGGEHPDYPENARKKVRGSMECIGFVIKDCPEINGCEIHSIYNEKMNGSMPKFFLNGLAGMISKSFATNMLKYIESGGQR